MSTFIEGIAARSAILSDADLEAEVERKHDSSRREAEAILGDETR